MNDLGDLSNFKHDFGRDWSQFWTGKVRRFLCAYVQMRIDTLHTALEQGDVEEAERFRGALQELRRLQMVLRLQSDHVKPRVEEVVKHFENKEIYG